MKKIWKKFKHWLIKKLGGFVNEPVPNHVFTSIGVPVRLNAKIEVDADMWYRRDQYFDDGGSFRNLVMDDLKNKLMKHLFSSDDLVSYKYTNNISNETVTIEATVMLHKFDQGGC